MHNAQGTYERDMKSSELLTDSINSGMSFLDEQWVETGGKQKTLYGIPFASAKPIKIERAAGKHLSYVQLTYYNDTLPKVSSLTLESS
uniref:Uncharacterized protein n=1 Tax=Magallana gigas TaxID=29159 RepID=K1RME0_MAGGI